MHLGCERTSMAIESISKIALPTNQPRKNHLRHQEQGNLRRSAPISTSQSLPFNRPRPIQHKLLYKDSALSLFSTSLLYVLRLRRKQSKKMWTNHTLLTHWTDLFFQCTRVEQGPTHLLIRLLTCRFQKLRKSPHSTNRDFPHYVCQTVSFSESACAVHLVTCSKRSSRLFVTCEKKSYWKNIESIFSFMWLPIPLIFLTRVGHVKKSFLIDDRQYVCRNCLVRKSIRLQIKIPSYGEKKKRIGRIYLPRCLWVRKSRTRNISETGNLTSLFWAKGY